MEHDDEDATRQRVVPNGHSELILNWDQPSSLFRTGSGADSPVVFSPDKLTDPCC